MKLLWFPDVARSSFSSVFKNEATGLRAARAIRDPAPFPLWNSRWCRSEIGIEGRGSARPGEALRMGDSVVWT